MINRSKTGDCSRCGAKNVPCRKRAKDLLCIAKCCNSDDRSKQMQKNKNKVRMLINSNNAPAIATLENGLIDNEAKKRLKRLGVFFNECALEIAKNPYCLNCGEPISFITGSEFTTGLLPKQIQEFKNATAHILPKGIFKSVETHPLNWLPLGARCGCHNDTHTIEKFAKMKVWPQAVIQFKQFEHEIKEKHKLVDVFKSYLK